MQKNRSLIKEFTIVNDWSKVKIKAFSSGFGFGNDWYELVNIHPIAWHGGWCAEYCKCWHDGEKDPPDDFDEPYVKLKIGIHLDDLNGFGDKIHFHVYNESTKKFDKDPNWRVFKKFKPIFEEK